MAQSPETDKLPYQGRTGVFFGGSSGTGLTTAIEFQRLGGTVILGASSESTFRRALANVRFGGGDRSSIKPLIGDVKETELLRRNIRTVVEEQAREGQPVTDILSFAAAGMPFAMQLDQEFLGPMNRIVAGNPPNRDELLEAKKAEMRRKYAVWLPEGRDEALAINYLSKINIINFFLEISEGKPLTFVDFNSTFGKEGKGPIFYGNVLTKHDFSVWLGEHAAELAEKGMDTAEIIAPVVEDTDVGRYLLTKVIPILKPELATVMIRTKIRRIHAFYAIKRFLDMSPEGKAQEGRPYERYVLSDYGNIVVLKTIPEELRIDSGMFDI